MKIFPALQQEIEQVAASQVISAEEFILQTLTEKINTLQHKLLDSTKANLLLPKTLMKPHQKLSTIF
jgi:hypothetical protein